MKTVAFLKQHLQKTSLVLGVVTIMLGGLPITNAAETPPADDPAITRKLNTLKLIWSDVEANPLGSDKRKEYMREFLSKSEPILNELPSNHSAVGGLWTMRVLSAIELNDQKLAILAGQQMLKLGLDKSSNELIQKALAQLDRKGWLDPEQAKAALEKEAAVTEARKQLERWVGNYRCKYFANFMTAGSLNGKLSISITPENKLRISGQGSYFLERKWDDRKPKVITDIDTSSFKIDAIVSPNKNGNIDLPGIYSSSRDYQNGYIDNVTRQTYRAFQADSAKLDSVRTASDNDKKYLGSGDLYMGVKYPTQEWGWESMYLFEKVVEGN